MEALLKMRKSIKIWFRYHFYCTTTETRSHKHFVLCLKFIEVQAKMQLYDTKDSLESVSKIILKTINKLSEEDLKKLDSIIRKNEDQETKD